ncbi:MAG: YifB family Mg chelatase-like AAA ATPase [Actinobacteria bacterium]|nr:YifB family Mg chelatase-like AAA ATPase [Actinomycetota bacterium]
MFATVHSATLLGVDGHAVTVEVHVSKGLPGFTVVGSPDTVCREARDRVRAALLSSGLEWPLRRITVNLAPSGLRKGGSGLDLAIAIAVLVASEKVPGLPINDLAFVGELGLDGSVRAVPGTLSMIDAVTQPAVVVGHAAAKEAELVGRHTVRSVATLGELVAALWGDEPWPERPPADAAGETAEPADLADVRGQPVARQAIEVAAAGGHHLLLYGPPGGGKTMLATRLVGLLPELDRAEALEATRIHSAAGAPLPPGGLVRRPPLRAPHHGASKVAVIGGGSSWMAPGEISLAHGGVLFLDEMAEFPVDVLEALRTPLEEGVVRVARANFRVSYPARFLLVGAMNPCPCGAARGPGHCRCTPTSLARYGRRLSGPLLDRFDLRVNISPPEPRDLLGGEPGESTAAVRERVERARHRAWQRQRCVNGQLTSRALNQLAPLHADCHELLEGHLASGRLSARGLRRIRCVALTIADLLGVEPPLRPDLLALAMQLRNEPAFLYERMAV